jgi:thymidylate kinase
VVWKACHDLKRSLNGKGDIDLLVHGDHKELFQKVVQSHGFVRATYGLLTFPFVEHYYGHDEATGNLCHLHVYYEIVTGESHLKSYHIPIINEIIDNRFLNGFNVYEASYSDQSLLYSMRHYMKRASFIGLLLWAYERGDYNREYEYINAGLRLKQQQKCLSGMSELRSEFNFLKLSFAVCFKEFWRAKRKVSSIQELRRVKRLAAVSKSLNNFGIRLCYKAFGVKKRLHQGLVLAISGVDGSGKSSMVRELRDWIGQDLEVKILQLGKPSPALVTVPVRALLSIFRITKNRNRVDSNKCTYQHETTSKKENRLTWAIRYLSLAYERHKMARTAFQLASIGKVVICDRYPTKVPGKMDSPKIGPGGTILVRVMRQLELHLYGRIPKADAVIFLDVSLEQAIIRNRTRTKKGKETDDEITLRHHDNQGLDFNANQTFIVDANRDYEVVLKDLKSIVWGTLLLANINHRGVLS